MSAEGITVMQKLSRLSDELNTLGDQLETAEQELEPIEAEYTRFIENYETGYFFQVERGEKPKLPSADMRLKLARREMPVELLGNYEGLRFTRDRLTNRIRTVKAQVEAQRSLLSAMKEGMI